MHSVGLHVVVQAEEEKHMSTRLIHRMRRGRTPKPRHVSPQNLPIHPDLLERRTLLSVSLDATTGVLAVTGTDAADQVAVRVSPSNPGDVHVQEGATIYIYRLAQVNSISVSGGAGDDTLTLDMRGGLLARAGVEMPVRFDGGAGSDSAVLTGGPASGGVTQTLALGPPADAGTHVSKAGALSQTVGFVGIESLVDLSLANALTVTLNEAANLVELSNGPLVNGLATSSLKAYDVTPCDHDTTIPAPQPAASQAATQVATASVPGSTAAVTAVDPQTVPDPKARKKLLRAYQQEARKAKAQQLKQLRQQQREQRLLAKRQRQTAAARAATAADVQALAPAPAAATGGRELVLGKTYLAVQFANKGRVTIDTGAGDDWVAVDHASAAAGLTALSVEGGAGADAVAEQAKPAGVTWAAAGAENVSPARNFILVNECTEPPAPQPQPEPPTGPTTPDTPTNPAASNGSASRGDDGDDVSSTGSRDNDSNSSGTRDTDSSSSSNASASSSTSSRDSDASGSNGD
jgi:hypothetical protein